MAPIALASVGTGKWGRKLVRVFDSLPEVRLKTICDAHENIRDGMATQNPHAQFESDLAAVLVGPEITAVVLAVPAVHHFETARQALEAEKHVYVEKAYRTEL